MEQRFKNLFLFDFQEKFLDKDSCLSYLADLKWSQGYKCSKCGHRHHCKGSMLYSRQCTCCHYVESPTAGTLFYQVKFDLVKALWIVYFVSTNKKGITSTELPRKLNIRQKTCWSFKRKAMKSSKKYPITGKADVDEAVFGQQEEGVRGRKNEQKKLVVVGIDKKNKGANRLYTKVISKANAGNLGGFMRDHIDPQTKIITDQWTGYNPLSKDFPNMIRILSGRKGNNVPELHRTIMLLKAWLRGIHRHVEDLQDYLDEYCYWFIRSFMKGKIFDNLMRRIVESPSCLVKNLSH